MDCAVVEPLEPQIEAGADLDHGSMWIPAHKLRHPLIVHSAPQIAGHYPQALVELLEIPIDAFHHFRGFGVCQNRPFPAIFHRPGE